MNEADKYDAILIDEGHDFEPDWFCCVVSQLRGGSQGNLIIGVDGAQSLYVRNRSATWKSVDVQAVGRTRRLSRNYCNTKLILEFAWQVSQSTVADEVASEAHERVLPTEAARQGPTQSHRGCATVAEEQALIARSVEQFQLQGLAHRDIAVLYPRRERDQVDALCRAPRRVAAVCWVFNEADPSGGVRSLTQPWVRLLTIHAAEGPEFSAVIFSASA